MSLQLLKGSHHLPCIPAHLAAASQQGRTRTIQGKQLDYRSLMALTATIYNVDVELSGLVQRLVVNDVEVGFLIEAELDRRHPERHLSRPYRTRL